MSEEKIIEELEEISQMVEGESASSVHEELNQIEKLASEAEKESTAKEPEKEPSKAEKTAPAKEPKEEKKEEKKQKEVEKKEENKEKVEAKGEKTEKKVPEKAKSPKTMAPEKAVRTGNGLLYASALVIVLGLIIYAFAFYLRWNGWRIINNPPSSAVALGGTLLILAGGEMYFRSKQR